MTTTTRRTGKVLKLLGPLSSPQQVVVDLGAEHGVNKRTEFLVYAEGEELRDPDTNESLGNLEIVRGRARPTHIQPRFSTVEAFEETPTRRIRKKHLATILGEEEEVIEASRESSYFDEVKVGDLVRVV